MANAPAPDINLTASCAAMELTTRMRLKAVGHAMLALLHTH